MSDCLFLSKQTVLVQKSAAEVNRTNEQLLIHGLKNELVIIIFLKMFTCISSHPPTNDPPWTSLLLISLASSGGPNLNFSAAIFMKCQNTAFFQNSLQDMEFLSNCALFMNKKRPLWTFSCCPSLLIKQTLLPLKQEKKQWRETSQREIMYRSRPYENSYAISNPASEYHLSVDKCRDENAASQMK